MTTWAASVGAPHLRARVWILAYPATQRGFLRDPNQTVFAGRRIANAGLAWSPEPDVARVVDGVPTGLDRQRNAALGNAVVPQVAEFIGRRILQAERGPA